MATLTKVLKFFKRDPVTEGAENFSYQQLIADNLDLIETFAKNSFHPAVADITALKAIPVDEIGDGALVPVKSMGLYKYLAAGSGTADDNFIVTPTFAVGRYYKIASPDLYNAATTAAKGLIQLATAAEVTAGADSAKAITPAGAKIELDKKINHALATATSDFLVGNAGGGSWIKKTLAEVKTLLGIDAATTAVTGVIRLATAAEVTTGTDAAKAVTPAGAKVELDKKVNHALAAAENDFLVGNVGGGSWIKKTLAEIKVILGLATDYAPASHATDLSKHVIASSCTKAGTNANAEGSGSIASGYVSHAEGNGTTASGKTSHAEGHGAVASGAYSHAAGYYTTANVMYSHALGTYNKLLSGGAIDFEGTADAFVVGNGTLGALSNAFRVTFDGKTYGLSAFNTTGADYAEFFEWSDGNTENEDRVGYFVAFEYAPSPDGDVVKIRKARTTDAQVLGVVSANPALIGDSYEEWPGRYLTDEWGRVQFHEVLVPATTTVIQVPIVGEDGKTIVGYEPKEVEETPEHTEIRPVYNPEWDSQIPYTPREKRKEWSTVGMLGKLLVRDDGTCIPGMYCRPNDDGIATASESGYRVMKRVSENIVKVLIGTA